MKWMVFRSLCIFPSWHPTTYIHKELITNCTDPKLLWEPLGKRLCKDVAHNIKNLSLSTTSCPNLSALAQRFQHHCQLPRSLHLCCHSHHGFFAFLTCKRCMVDCGISQRPCLHLVDCLVAFTQHSLAHSSLCHLNLCRRSNSFGGENYSCSWSAVQQMQNMLLYR